MSASLFDLYVAETLPRMYREVKAKRERAEEAFMQLLEDERNHSEHDVRQLLDEAHAAEEALRFEFWNTWDADEARRALKMRQRGHVEAA